MAWKKTLGVTGLLVGGTELSYLGGELLLYSQIGHFKDGHSSGPEYHASYTSDHYEWDLQEKLIPDSEYVGLSTGRNTVAVGGIQNDNFVLKTAADLSFTHEDLEIIKLPENRTPTYVRTRHLVDTHFFLYTGFLIYYVPNVGHHTVALDDRYKDYNILDITHFRTEFIILLEKENENAIAYSNNAIDFVYYDVHWPDVVPKSIVHNDNQVVILGHDGSNCCVLYSSDPISRQWFRLTFTPDTKNDRSVTSFNDAVYINGDWYIVGDRKELNSGGNLQVSAEGLTYVVHGDITNTSEFIKESNYSCGLDKVYYDIIQNKLYSIGKGIPNGDRFVSYRELV